MECVAMRPGPEKVTSKRTITYRRSEWRVQEFEVWSGEMVCRCAVLRMPGALLVWLGGGAAPALGEAALGLPAPASAAAALLGREDGAAPGLARRLAAALARPVHVCLGASFDRFTWPLVERALMAHLKSMPL